MKQLVFIGDSLTEWYDWQRRFLEYRVTNLGISGETVEGLLARRERIRSRVESPDFLFLMTGINNLANGSYDIMPSYREIVRNFTTWYKKAAIVVQSILPVDPLLVNDSTITGINRSLAAIADEEGARFLDVHRFFVDADGGPKPGYLSDDGVHLAARGYKAWSEAVEEYLRKSSSLRTA